VRALAVLVVLLAAGCSLGGDEPQAPSAGGKAFLYPAWLDETYTDGRITIRYPADWTRGHSDRFGEYVDDATNRTAAFVAVYLPERTYEDHAEFAEVAAGILRPPSGKGTALAYTQTARIGDRRGVEASIVLAASESNPRGPMLRVYGIELESGAVAILVFAAENWTNHANELGWIKRAITWG
jgi:hypothetical protein